MRGGISSGGATTGFLHDITTVSIRRNKDKRMLLFYVKYNDSGPNNQIFPQSRSDS